jgi:hypothetical protein
VNSYGNSSPQVGAYRNGKSGPLEGRILSGTDGGLQELSLSPNLIGSGLSIADLAALEARWIDRPLAEAALLRRSRRQRPVESETKVSESSGPG